MLGKEADVPFRKLMAPLWANDTESGRLSRNTMPFNGSIAMDTFLWNDLRLRSFKKPRNVTKVAVLGYARNWTPQSLKKSDKSILLSKLPIIIDIREIIGEKCCMQITGISMGLFTWVTLYLTAIITLKAMPDKRDIGNNGHMTHTLKYRPLLHSS